MNAQTSIHPRSLSRAARLPRHLAAASALFCLTTGCVPVTCGPDTVRQQRPDGTVACIPVTVQKGEIICDADAGVELQSGNRCVSIVRCGAGTLYDPATHSCLVAAQGPHAPPACPTPSAGHVCINGTLRNLVDGSFLSNQTVRVQLLDPAGFFGGATPQPLAETTATDTFVFADAPPSSMGYLMVRTLDPSGAPAQYHPTAISAGPVKAGQSFRLDGYVLTEAQVAAWSSAGKVDFAGGATLLYRFFNDPAPPAGGRTPTESHPVAGVQLIDGATQLAADGAVYLSPSLSMADAALTMTSTSGAVLITRAGGSPLSPGFTGKGGGITWETHQALPVSGMVLIDFLHPQP